MKLIKNGGRDRNRCENSDYIHQDPVSKWRIINSILLLAVLFSCEPGFGQSAQFKTGLTYVNQPISGSSAQWLGLSNCVSSDNIYSVPTANLANSGDYTDYLVITNFQFTIPGGSTISGISVSIENSDANGKSKDARVSLVKNGVIGSIDKSISSAWSGSDAVKSYGASNDLWGDSWSISDLNSSNFGVVFSAKRTGGGPQPTLAKVDQIYITVFYNPPTTLPVQLIYFDAQSNNNSVQLSWQTATEVNNDFFTILKSTDGLEFYEIQKISGAGTSSNLNFYHYTDTQVTKGISYYRLKQTDFDGKIELFRIIAIFNKESEGHDINIKIIPTAFKETFTAQFELNESENVQLKMICMNGTVVQQLQVQAQKGINRIQVEVPSGIKASSYILSITSIDEFLGEARMVCIK